MKTIIAAIEIETRGQKCGQCRFQKLGPTEGPYHTWVCALFQRGLNYKYNDRNGHVSADRLLQCLACDEV